MSNEPEKIYIEKSGSGLVAVLAVALMVIVAVGVFAFVQNQQAKDNAVATAAQQVGDAAEDVSQSVKDALNN